MKLYRRRPLVSFVIHFIKRPLAFVPTWFPPAPARPHLLSKSGRDEEMKGSGDGGREGGIKRVSSHRTALGI